MRWHFPHRALILALAFAAACTSPRLADVRSGRGQEALPDPGTKTKPAAADSGREPVPPRPDDPLEAAEPARVEEAGGEEALSERDGEREPVAGPPAASVQGAGELSERAEGSELSLLEEAPLQLGGADVIGARVEDAEGRHIGFVYDLLVHPTGTLARVVLAKCAMSHGTPDALERLRQRALLAQDADAHEKHEQHAFDAFHFGRVGEEIVLRLRAGPSRSLAGVIDHERLFEGRELERLEGLVHAVGSVSIREREPYCVLELHDQNNRYHRVLLAPERALEEAAEAMQEGRRVEVRGLFTHDERGKLFVASSLAAGGAALRLRGPDGLPLWPALDTRPDLVPRRLFFTGVSKGHAAVADPMIVVGFCFDRESGAVTAVELQDGPLHRTIDFDELQIHDGQQWLEDGTWLLAPSASR